MTARQTADSPTVAIVGAGPSGLTLANLLQRRQVPCVVVDKFTREQLLSRARAGMLEYRTVELLNRLGIGTRMHEEGRAHERVEFRMPTDEFILDLPDYYEGRSQHIYPQQEVVRDLLDAFIAGGGDVRLGCAATALDASVARPVVRLDNGSTLEADFVAGCDGTYGVARAAAPAEIVEYCMDHEFQWLTCLAEAAPSAGHTIYAVGAGGFAGHLLRTQTVTRFHLQVPVGDVVEDWSDDRIWTELHDRFARPGFVLNDGPIFSKNMLEMASRVCEPMQYGRVFLVGDAAHIITPCGGKGMNLAMADAVEFDRVLREYEESGDEAVLGEYSPRRLPDIWKAQEFSHSLLHTIHSYTDGPDAAFRQKLQQSRLWQLKNQSAYARSFAESFVGPLLGDLGQELWADPRVAQPSVP